MERYKFIVGMSATALEADLNRVAESSPEWALHQIFFAPGTGFIAVVENRGRRDPPVPPATPKAASRTPRKK